MFTFKAETNLVTLHVSVLDKNDHLITDIPQSAFHVYENDEEQEIRLFKREDVPVSMCILIDSSGSMRDKHASVVAAALALVRQSNPDDEVCFVNFNDEAYIDQDFTNDINKLDAKYLGREIAHPLELVFSLVFFLRNHCFHNMSSS